MTTYYISGQMRGRSEYNRPAFLDVERAFRDWLPDEFERGNGVILNPTHNFNGEQGLPTTTYMNEDLKQVLQADVVVQICGTDEFGGHWNVSEGAYREAQLGVWAGKGFIEARLVNYCRLDGDDYAAEWKFVPVDAPNFSTSVRASVLDEAKQLITGDRNNQYGPPTQDFDRTAGMASAFGFQVNGQPLQGHHVAIFMMLLKVSRLAWTPAKRDSWVDASGYAGCGAECAGVK